MASIISKCSYTPPSHNKQHIGKEGLKQLKAGGDLDISQLTRRVVQKHFEYMGSKEYSLKLREGKLILKKVSGKDLGTIELKGGHYTLTRKDGTTKRLEGNGVRKDVKEILKRIRGISDAKGLREGAEAGTAHVRAREGAGTSVVVNNHNYMPKHKYEGQAVGSGELLEIVREQMKQHKEQFEQQQRFMDRQLVVLDKALDVLGKNSRRRDRDVVGQKGGVGEKNAGAATQAERVDREVCEVLVQMREEREDNAQLREGHGKKIGELEGLVNQLQEGARQTKTKMAELEGKNEGLRNGALGNGEEIGRKNAEITQLQSNLAAKQDELVRLTATHSEVQEEIGSLGQQLRGKEDELQEAKGAFASKRGQLEEELNRLRSDLGDKEAELEQLRSSLKTKEDEFKLHAETLSRQNEELILGHAYDNLLYENQLKKLQSSLQEKEHELQEAKNALTSEKERLEEELNRLRSDLEAKQEELTQSIANRQTAEKQNFDLERQLTDQTQDTKFLEEEVKTRITLLGKARDDLKEGLEREVSLCKEIGELKNQVQELNTSLKTELKKAEQKLKNNSIELEKEKNDQFLLFAETNGRLQEDIRKANAAHSTELKTLEIERDKLQAELKKAQEDLAFAGIGRSFHPGLEELKLDEGKSGLPEDLPIMNTVNDVMAGLGLKTKEEHGEGELQEAKSSLASEKELNQLKSDLEDKEAELENLRVKLQKQKSVINWSTHSEQQDDRKIKALETELEQLRLSLKKKEDAFNELQSRAETINTQNRELLFKETFHQSEIEEGRVNQDQNLANIEKIERLERELELLKTALEREKNVRAQQDKDILRYTDNLNSQQLIIQDKERAIEELREMHSSEDQAKLTELDGAIQGLKGGNEEYVRKIETLDAENKAKNADKIVPVFDNIAQSLTHSRLALELALKESEIKRLKAKLFQIKQENESGAQKSSSLGEGLKQLQDSLTTKQEELKQSVTNHQETKAQNAELAQQLSDQEQSLVSLRGELQAKTEQLEKAQADLETSLTDASEKVRALETERSYLQTAFKRTNAMLSHSHLKMEEENKVETTSP